MMMRICTHRTLSISLSFLLIVSMVSWIFPGASCGRSRDILGPMYGEPEIDIEIMPGKYQANVQPGQDGLVTILGRVLCDMPPYTPSGVYCIVTLFVDAGGWYAPEQPELIFSKATVSREFSITIMVPIESSPNESRDVSISGMWDYSPGTQGGTTETESVHVDVLPYVYLLFRTESHNTTIDIGERSTYAIEIENRGTSDASVTLMSRSDSEVLRTELNSGSLDIPPKQIGEVELSFEQPSGPEGVYTVTLSAQDVEHGGQEPIIFTFKVTTREKGFSITSVPYLIYIIIALVMILCLGGATVLGRKVFRKK
ncbi:MAG: hypothetical protein JW939_01080 [Candidatus Thermoplasmatota archaeon]|nr:hypothetical protein [Candidatus Thermoplasmatota archaeon]